ncbi:uncharacterized protein VTP21DRAFT_6352 [Calcarisporiella thermophila]|uniref:uncharacterized protein n=1 Tax=Calcarisporiella thermophila TaxID=911321 RepID=UPI003743105A
MYIKNAKLFTRNQREQWLFKRLFQPVRICECEDVEILDISKDGFPKFLSNRESQRLSENPQAHPEDTCTLAPQTMVYTLAEGYRIVFLIDVSASLATIDVTSNRVILDDVLKSLEKCLEGVTEPMNIFRACGGNPIKLLPKLYITVVAECSQFGSNTNVIELLSDFSTMRVLIQGAQVSLDNLEVVKERLRSEFDQFLSDIIDFRQRLAEKRKRMGYKLDVNDPSIRFRDPDSPPIDTDESAVDSSVDSAKSTGRRENWGIGVSGANLSYNLHAGLFALKLLPQELWPVLVLITDGVKHLGTGPQEQQIIRIIKRLDISCSVIQVGGSQGFTPACNFGFVPDNENLRFLAEATSGQFVYAGDWNAPISSFDSVSSEYKDHTGATVTNFFHRAFLIRQHSFSPKRSNIQLSATSGNTLDRAVDVPRERIRRINDIVEDIAHNPYNFPWDPKSKPPLLEKVLIQYRDYALAFDIVHVISARIRQGFHISSVSLPRNRSGKQGRLYITMVLQWLPNVSVQYKIKPFWPGKEVGCDQLRHGRIEVMVLASAVFAYNFVESHHRHDPGHPLWDKINRLHSFLRCICDTDEMLKRLVVFNPKHHSSKAAYREGEIARNLSNRYLDAIKRLWEMHDAHENRARIRCWFDEGRVDVLVLTDGISSLIQGQSRHIDDQVRHAMGTLCESLDNNWADLKVANDVFVKVIGNRELEKISSISYCELRLYREAGCLLAMRLAFFNVGLSDRRKILDDLELMVSNMSGKLLTVCERPLSLFLIRRMNSFETRTEQDYATRSVYASVTERLTSQFIVRNYLRHTTSVWLDNLPDDPYCAEHGILPVRLLAFQLLCRLRLEQSFVILGSEPHQKVFYLELKNTIETSSRSPDPSVDEQIAPSCGVQYIITLDKETNQVTTELWVEPNEDQMLHNPYEWMSEKISATDRKAISHLITFYEIHRIGRIRPRPAGLGLPDLLDSGLISTMPNYFEIAYVLRLSRFLVASYSMPTFKTSLLASGRANEVDDWITVQTDLSSETSARRSSLDEFITQQDLISKLSRADRDCVLLHLFLGQSLRNITDAEIPTSKQDAHDPFWRDITRAVQQVMGISSVSAGLLLTESLRDCRCFVKVVNPQSFILLVAPTLRSLTSNLARTTAISSNFMVTCQVNRFMLFAFECVRTQSPFLDSRYDADPWGKATTDYGEIHIKPLSDSTADTETNNSSPTMRPDLFAGHFQTTPSNIELTRAAFDLKELFSKHYARDYVRSVYASLVQKHIVDPQDLARAASMCSESSVEVDITGFVNVQTQLRSQAGLSFDTKSIQESFSQVLSHYFQKVEGSEGSQSLYYFRPQFKKGMLRMVPDDDRSSTGVSAQELDRGSDAPDSLLNLIEGAEEPFFLRLECEFRKPASNSEKYPGILRMPVAELPVSYTAHVNGDQHDFSPESIGTEASPVESSDGTQAFFHLICIYLPPMDQDAATTIQASGNLEDTQLLKDALLDEDKREALAETKTRLEWLLKEEIMHGLLKLQPVTSTVLCYIESQLRIKNPYVDFPTSFPIPVPFVRKHAAKHIFLQELAKANISPYTMNRVDEHFYVSEDVIESSPTQPAECVKEDVNPSADVQEERASLFEHESPKDDELSQGLGISFLTPPEMDHMQAVASRPRNVVQKQMFWMLLIPHENSVQMYFFSKCILGADRSNIIRHMRNAIRDVAVRVNQLTLLIEMNETRKCSKYLVPRDTPSGSDSDTTSSESESSSGSGPGSPEEDLVGVLSLSPEDQQYSKRFKPGQFACPLVFTKRFPLHWRLKPCEAVNCAANFLQPLAVRNRKNLFVHGSGESTVYMRLFEIGVLSPMSAADGVDELAPSMTSSPFSAQSAISEPPNLVSTSIAGPTTQQHVESSRGSPRTHSPKQGTPSPGTRFVSSGAQQIKSAPESRELVLEVYGIDRPSKQIVEDLVNTLEQKLMSSATLMAISTFLARGASQKLTPADVDFILPVEKPPACQKIIPIPRMLRDIHAYITYLRQKLLTYMKPLSGPDVANAVFRHYLYQGHKSQNKNYPVKEELGETYEIHPGDFAFYYNSLGTWNQSAFETEVGRGIAGVCLTIRDVNGLPALTLPVQDPLFTEYSYLENIGQHLSQYQDDTQKPGTLFQGLSAYSLLIEIWVQGPLKYNVLLTKLEQTIYHTLCDYSVESCIMTGLVRTFDRSPNLEAEEAAPVQTTPVLDTRIQKLFVQPCFAVLEKAAAWGDPTVQELNLSVKLAPWSVKELLDEVCEFLSELHAVFTPVVMRGEGQLAAPLYVTEKLEVERPHQTSTGAPTAGERRGQGAVRHIVIGGVKELTVAYGGWHPSLTGHRRSVDGDDHSFKSHSRKSSVENGTSDKASLSLLRKDDLASERSSGAYLRKEVFSTNIANRLHELTMHSGITVNDGSRRDLARSCFCSIVLDGWNLRAYTYNMNKRCSDAVFAFLTRLLDWHTNRIRLMDTILHQKMGLFFHTEPFDLERSATGPLLASGGSSTSVAAQHAHVTSTSTPRPSSGRTPLRPLQPPPPPLQLQTQQQAHPQQLQDVKLLTSLVMDSIPPRQRATLPVGIVSEESKKATALGSAVAGASSSSINMLPSDAGQPTEQEPGLFTFKGVKVNDVLKMTIADPVRDSTYARNRDPLRRHGHTFVEAYRRINVTAQAHENALRVYTKWRKRFSESPGSTRSDESISSSDLVVILRSARLFHFCRKPLLFSHLSMHSGRDVSGKEDVQRSPVATEDSASTLFQEPLSVELKAPEDITTQWYRDLVQTFVREYAEYLETLGMQRVTLSDAETSAPDRTASSRDLLTSRFAVTEHFQVESPVLFLLKALRGGSIILEIRIQRNLCCVTLYTLNRRYSRLYVPGPLSDLQKRENLRLFTAECGRFKNIAHVNSFVHDFHLRFLQRILGHPTAVPPIRALDVLREFMAYYRYPARYARNRVVTDTYPLSEVLPEIFAYILGNPQRYGFRPLLYEGRAVGCFVMSESPDFHEECRPGPYCHTLIVCADDPSYSPTHDGFGIRSGLKIRFYVMVTSHDYTNLLDRVVSTPARRLRPNASDDAVSHELMQETLAPVGYTLGYVVENATQRLKMMIRTAAANFRRDSLWRRLISDNSTSYSADGSSIFGGETQSHAGHEAYGRDGLSSKEFLMLARKFNGLPLRELDPQIDQLLDLPLVWSEAFDFLQNFFAPFTRVFLQDPDEHESPMHTPPAPPVDSTPRYHFQSSQTSSTPHSLHPHPYFPPASTSSPARASLHRIRHLVILNPSDRDYLLHFVLDEEATKPVKGYAVCRERRQSQLERKELEHITSVGETLCYWLWRKICS